LHFVVRFFLTVCHRAFVLWNPPVKERDNDDDIQAQRSPQTKKKTDRCSPVSSPVKLCAPSSSVASKVDEFLLGCEDRPKSFGSPTKVIECRPDSTDSHASEIKSVCQVDYVGGWHRGKKQKVFTSYEKPVETSKTFLNHKRFGFRKRLHTASKNDHERNEEKKNDSPEQMNQRRTSAIVETASLFTTMIENEIRTLAFCQVTWALVYVCIDGALQLRCTRLYHSNAWWLNWY
jgi:hypothetical protein